MKSYIKLKEVFNKLAKLNYVQNIMIWDEAVMMPIGAGDTLSSSMAALNGVTHKILNSKKNKKLIASAKEEITLSTWDKANLQLMERKYLRATAIPTKLMEKFTKETLICQQAWRTLRAQNNWQAFLPYFQRVFKLVREISKRYGDLFQLAPYDAMIDEYAPGFNIASIDAIFSGLKLILPDLIKEIIEKQSKQSFEEIEAIFPIDKQKAIGLQVMKALQFDFNHGRLDISHHPFCIGNAEDVRITTRYNEHEFISALLGICHETGHGLYEQGMPTLWKNQPVGTVVSMAMHESQSLLIEMQIGKSQAFYEYLSPMIQEHFGKQENFSAENLYKLVTRVKPNLIRVNADEVTYPLHIILRYELEKKLFNDEIKINDLPAYWNESMTHSFGISTVNNFKEGVMQDVHWPAGAFGYFPAYTLGRLIAAQLFACYQQVQPNYMDNIKQGNFHALKKWLQENVYAYASSLSTNDLLVKVTGKSLDSSYFINHIKRRYLA